MHNNTDGSAYGVVRALGSLWLGGVLLVLLLVGMACATVFEVWHGAEQALAMFYKSWWFAGFLLLLAVNISIAVFLRWPFTKKRIGFVTTHTSILVILAGAVVTQFFGVDGHVSLWEGETTEDVTISRDTLTVTRTSGDSEDAEISVQLSGLRAGGLVAVERPATPALNLDDVTVEVARYLPDSAESREVENDGPMPLLAVELSLSGPSSVGDESRWVFADQTTVLGSTSVLFREVDEDELRRLSQATPEADPKQPASVGTVRVELEGSTCEFSVEECRQKAVPVGETGFTLRVARYLPQARVGRDGQLRNMSNQPLNPTIEVEIAGPEGTLKRPAFAKFPDFWSTHGGKGIAGLKVTFVASSALTPSAPIQVLSGPDGKLTARFHRPGQPAVIEELTVGKACETPFAGRRLTVHRRFDRARMERVMTPIEPVRQNRIPAVLLDVKSPSGTESLWLQKGTMQSIAVDGSTYRVVYGNQLEPLGFSVTLRDFEVGYYSGSTDERSYESLITILDSTTARKLNRVISMNRPATYGGYTFYQSSFRQQGGREASVLSVSWDPGQPIAFAGYLGLMAGMLIVLGQRIADRRGPADRPPEAPAAKGKRSKSRPSKRQMES
ncbi:MAG: cytochrome c biogenesis protein ResB [Planctomycetota bacterium]|jgi:hypothetical protein